MTAKPFRDYVVEIKAGKQTYYVAVREWKERDIKEGIAVKEVGSQGGWEGIFPEDWRFSKSQLEKLERRRQQARKRAVSPNTDCPQAA